MVRKIDRRTFTHSSVLSTAALSGLAILPKPVRGANEKITIGMIGVGRRGTTLLSSFSREEDVAVAAISDIDDKHIKAAIERTEGQAKGYRDFRTMLERNDIDAVVIGTPDHWHALTTIKSCQAGKDVYVEKPLSHNVREGQVMKQVAAETNRIVQMGTQQRSQSHWQKAVEIVQSGSLGKISEVNAWNNFSYRSLGNPPNGTPPEWADYDFWLGPAPKRPFNPNRFHATALYFWDYAGGCVTSWGVHLIDIVYRAMKLKGPKSVSASGGKYIIDDNRETPDTFSSIFDFSDFIMTYRLRHWNGLCTLVGNYGKAGHGVEFHGVNGSLYVDRFCLELRGIEDRIPSQSLKGGNSTPAHIRNFLDCVKSRQKPNSSIEYSHAPSVATFLANISYRTGRKILWDAENELILDAPEANKYLSRDYRHPWRLV